MKIAVSLFSLAVSCVFWTQVSYAWVPFGNTWSNATATMSLNLNVDDPPDQAGLTDPWNIIAEDALAQWNAVPGAKFQFLFNNSNQDACNTAIPGSNAVEWGDVATCGGGLFDPFTLAVTVKSDMAGGVSNSDVLFNRAFTWTSADPGFTLQEPINFNTVAMHEFGHVLGLTHEDNELAIMNTTYHPNPHRLHADDRLGARVRYPGAGSETDIAPSNWKKTTPGPAAASLVSSPRSAVAGETITVEWTQENLGTTDVSFNIGFLLSTDSTVSPSDTLLARSLGAF